jgi:enoyl-CoA hydratase/carnithine racemase
VLRQLANFPAPTFAAAQGACLGVGLGLLIACDVVYVDQAAKIGSPFASLGALLDCGGHALFYERLGAHRTLDLAYSGQFMSGTEAVAAGLFSRALPLESLDDFARQMAARTAAGPTAAFAATKKVIAALREQRLGLWDVMEIEAGLQAKLSATADYQEGMAAFRSKRTPVFTGR